VVVFGGEFYGSILVDRSQFFSLILVYENEFFVKILNKGVFMVVKKNPATKKIIGRQ